MENDHCEVTPRVNHDVHPAEYSWECTCGAAEDGFATRPACEESSDRHLDAVPAPAREGT